MFREFGKKELCEVLKAIREKKNILIYSLVQAMKFAVQEMEKIYEEERTSDKLKELESCYDILEDKAMDIIVQIRSYKFKCEIDDIEKALELDKMDRNYDFHDEISFVTIFDLFEALKFLKYTFLWGEMDRNQLIEEKEKLISLIENPNDYSIVEFNGRETYERINWEEIYFIETLLNELESLIDDKFDFISVGGP